MQFVRGDRLDHYVVQDKLGQGGMGAVYKVQDVDSGEVFAVKVPTGSDPRFEAELRTLAAIRHPHVVAFEKVYPLRDGGWALFMAFAQGASLDSFVESKPPISVLATLLNQAAMGLDHCHAHGVVHRDIKPANVMVTVREGDWHSLLVDFGLGREDDYLGRGTVTGDLAGTPPFMSPEQFADFAAVGPSTDQWALAVSAWQLLTGDFPFPLADPRGFPIPDFSHKAALPTSVRTRFPDLQRVFDKAFRSRPDQRFPSCLAFTQAMGAALGLALPKQPRDVPEPPRLVEPVVPPLPKLPDWAVDHNDVFTSYAADRLSNEIQASAAGRIEWKARVSGRPVQTVTRGDRLVIRLPGEAELPTGTALSTQQQARLIACGFRPPSAADPRWTLEVRLDHPVHDVAHRLLAGLQHGYGVSPRDVATQV